MKLLCFGLAKDIIGSSEYELTHSAVNTVGELKHDLKTTFPDFNNYKQFQIAVNQSFAKDNDPISASDEIAIIPPVSGG